MSFPRIHPSLEVIPPPLCHGYILLWNPARLFLEDMAENEKVFASPVQNSIELAPIVASKLSQRTVNLRTVWERRRRILRR